MVVAFCHHVGKKVGAGTYCLPNRTAICASAAPISPGKEPIVVSWSAGMRMPDLTASVSVPKRPLRTRSDKMPS
jgi:hypothetical protein